MKHFLLLIFLIAILSACAKKKQINLVFSNSRGLTKESPLLINGYQIGEIEEFKLLPEQKTMLKIDLTEDLEIPKDSKFSLVQSSLLGDAFINLELGESKLLISDQDTIQCLDSLKINELDKRVQQVLKNVIDLTDSLASRK